MAPDHDEAAALRKIGEVAAATELSIKTIRHYDEVGLVQPSARSAGGFRLYTPDDVDRLLTIRRMKPLGFSLEEMGAILQAIAVLSVDDASDAERVEARDVVQSYRSRVSESTLRLRTHLAYAEELAERLDDIAR
ncbi:MerR family transcriptional regulator [uncultured Williamsia sp.]|uniref:MerR family transcriptional regulator n=1 Tax=uncultured Williamsia sp. TaxID=259311 RepID=UPI0026203DEB|nr:MerR family transcriptional regulator [uncultured Williamsia sp.]